MAAQKAEAQIWVDMVNPLRDGDVLSLAGGIDFTVDTTAATNFTTRTFPDGQGLYDLLVDAFPDHTVTNNFADAGGDDISMIANNYGDQYNLTPTSVTPDTTFLAVVSTTDNISPLAATATITHETSPGNGSIVLDVSGGTTPYTYSWSNGATTKDISGLTAGNYTVTIDSADGQQFIETYTVLDQLLDVSIATTDVNCNGGSDGTATLTVSGGTSPYTYAWSDGPTVKDRTDLSAGMYEVTVTDSASNFVTKEVVISEPTAISILAEVDGRDIDVTVSGGTPPYTYAWSDDINVTTQDRTNLDPGDYTVTVTDANSCTKQATITIAPFTFYFSENPILLELTAATPETKPNLSFVCDVYIEKVYNSGTFTKVITAEQPADSAGKTIFDMQELVGAFVNEEVPDVTSVAIARADSFRRFYLSYTEKYGDPPVEGTFTQQDTFFCLLGGLNAFEHARKKFFDWLLPNTKPFFTWWPAAGKDLYSDQVEFLYYMVNKFGITTLHLKADFTYTDGTTSGKTEPLASIASPTRFEVYRVPVSYTALGIAALAKEVEYLKLWMEDEAANVISEVRRYNIKDPHPRLRQFMYLNSLGGWDTLVVTERISGTMATKSDELLKRLLPKYAQTDSAEEVLKKTGLVKYQYGVLLKNSEAAHLLDFALSRRVFEIRTFESSDLAELIPVRIVCDPEFIDEVENYNEFTFDVVYPESTKYTPLL